MRCDISSEGHCGDLGEGPIGEPVKMLAPGPRTERGSRLSQGWGESGEGERHKEDGQTRADASRQGTGVNGIGSLWGQFPRVLLGILLSRQIIKGFVICTLSRGRCGVSTRFLSRR